MTQDGSKEDRQTMSRKTYKTIETPSGSGEIRKAGARLAKVFYHLQVRQETIVGELAAGQEDRPGRLDIAWANFPDIQSLHCKTRRWDSTLRVAL